MGCCGGSRKERPTKEQHDHQLSPLDLLKIRLAKGEISFEEYEKTKTVLSQ